MRSIKDRWCHSTQIGDVSTHASFFSLDCWTINFTVYCSCVPNQLQRVKLVINIGTFIKTCSFKTKWIAFGFYSINENVENKKRRFNNICKNKTLGIRGGTIKFHNIILIAIFKRARITIQNLCHAKDLVVIGNIFLCADSSQLVQNKQMKLHLHRKQCDVNELLL